MVPGRHVRDHRMVSNQTSTPTPPPAAPRPDSNRFFAWLRSLGIVRADGWVGGVCGGIAIRTGLDPLIVRGIAIVAAILGSPVLFFYAAAWLLLPDTRGDIHLERMLRGVFDAPLIAIAVLVVLTFVPFTHGVWWVGDHVGSAAWWIAAPAGVLRVLWNLAILGALAWFVVWLVQRYRNTPRGARPFAPPPAGGTPTAPTAPFAGTDQTAAQPAATGAAWVAQAGTDSAVGERAEGAATAASAAAADAPAEASASAAADPLAPPAAPIAPGAGSDRDAYAEWRAQYDAWRVQHAQWQDQQRAASAAVRGESQAARLARSAESRARAQQYAAEAARQREARRAANPRAAAWLVALVVGAALVAGGITAAVVAQGDLARYAAPIGMAIALMVIGLGMVVAGIARRRSGALAFWAIVAIVLGLGSFGWPVHDSPIGYTQLRADRDISFDQFAGQVEIDASQAAVGSDGVRHVDIDQTFGAVALYIGDDVHARVEVKSLDSNVHPYTRAAQGYMDEQPALRVESSDGTRRVARTWSNTDGAPDLIVDVTQGHGAVYIYDGGANPSSGNDYRD